MSFVHLVRHGEPASGWGEPGGSLDPGLTEKGRVQAEAAARLLNDAPAGERPTRLLTSPLLRCRETAEPSAALFGLQPVVTTSVAEIPTPEGVQGPERAAWLRTAMGGSWAQVPGIDGDVWRRTVIAALLEAKGTAVFTHFVAINAAVSAAQGSEAVLVHRPAPGSITTLRITGGRLELVRLGEALPDAGRVL